MPDDKFLCACKCLLAASEAFSRNRSGDFAFLCGSLVQIFEQIVSTKAMKVSNTAIWRKVVGKSVRDNPERHCGWF